MTILDTLVPAEQKRRETVQKEIARLKTEEEKRLADRQVYRKKRIDTFMAKARAEDRIPESYGTRRRLAIYMFAIGNNIGFYGEKALIEAAKLGDIKKGEWLLQHEPFDINARDENGETALYHAIRRKRLGFAEMLLQYKAKNVSKGDTPLIVACADGQDLAIPLFARYHVDLNKPIKYRKWNKYFLGWQTYHIYPICVAALNGQNKVVSSLLQHGARIDVEYIPGTTLQQVLETENNFTPAVKAAFAPTLAKKIATQKILPSSQQAHIR